jgi:hypothetical protein
MSIRIALAAGAALGVFVMSGAAAQADVTAHKKSHHRAGAAVPSRETVELKHEVEDLKAQLQSLASRLDAQIQAQQQTQAQALAAQSQAQTAQTTAMAAQTQVEADASKILTIPAQVDTATKKAAPKPGWWNETKLGATMYGDVSNINNRNAAGKTAQSGTNYDIKRMYLTVDHKFNDTYSFNLTTDFTFDSNATSPSGAGSPTANEAGGANTASGIKATQLYIKKAYLQAHYNDAFNVRLGAADLPWIPFVEGIYGYRYVEQTLIDRTKFGTSADWGLNAYGSLFDGFLNYSVSVIDGEGYKQPALGNVNRTHAIDVEGRANINYKGFTVAVGGYDGKLGKDVQNVQTFETAQRFDALAAYTDKHIRFGVEYLWARYWNDVTQANPAKTNTTDGYSVFGSYNFTPKVALFGKYEWVKPKANTVPGENENYFNVGVSYKPITPLDFAVVYKRDSVVNGSFSTGNGVIGIPTGATVGKGTYDEIGLFTQVKF